MSASSTVERIALTIVEVATALGVSSKTVRRMIADGELRAIRIRESVRIPRAELDRVVSGT